MSVSSRSVTRSWAVFRSRRSRSEGANLMWASICPHKSHGQANRPGLRGPILALVRCAESARDDDRRADQGRVEAAVGQVAGRRVVLDADLDGDPGLSEGAHGLVGRLPDLGEPEGLRRAAGGPVRPRDAGDHNGAPLLGERAPVRGVRGLAPVRPLLRQRRGSRGFEGGRSLPSPEPSVRTLGRLAQHPYGPAGSGDSPANRSHRATAYRGRSRPLWPAPRRWGGGGPPPGTAAPDSRPGSALSLTGRGNLSRTVTGNAVPRA